MDIEIEETNNISGSLFIPELIDIVTIGSK